MEVFQLTVNSGEKKLGKVFIGSLAHGAEVSIPVLVLRGKKEGPTLWINCLVHGDELNGALASWELFHELSVDDVAGNLVITPVSNPLAFEHRDKIADIDLIDMDTTFPGDPKGLFAQRTAYVLFEEIKKHANYLLHFHTLHTHFKAVAYTVSKIVPQADQAIIDKSREMALAFGCETNCVVDLATATGELPGVTRGALDITCIQHNIPAFMAEVGSGGKIDRKFVAIAKQGVINLMIYLGMMEGTLSRPEKQYIITKRKFLRSDYGGFTTVKVEPGEVVEAGQVLAETHYFGPEIHTTTFQEKAYVIAARENPVVNTGDRLAFVGTQWEVIHNK